MTCRVRAQVLCELGVLFPGARGIGEKLESFAFTLFDVQVTLDFLKDLIKIGVFSKHGRILLRILAWKQNFLSWENNSEDIYINGWCYTLSKQKQSVSLETELKRRKWFSGFMLRVKETVWATPGQRGRQEGRRHYHINDVRMAFSGERQRSSNLNSGSFPSSVWRLEVTREGSSAQTIFSPFQNRSGRGLNCDYGKCFLWCLCPTP